MPQILVFSFPLVTLEFSIHNLFKTRMLLEIFDAEFPYKLFYFEPLCLLNKTAVKTVKRSIVTKTNYINKNINLPLSSSIFDPLKNTLVHINYQLELETVWLPILIDLWYKYTS